MVRGMVHKVAQGGTKTAFFSVWFSENQVERPGWYGAHKVAETFSENPVV